MLTEGPAILLYLADLKPEASWRRRRARGRVTASHEWLAFISAEIHGGFGPLFNTDLEASARAWWQARLESGWTIRRPRWTPTTVAGRRLPA